MSGEIEVRDGVVFMTFKGKVATSEVLQVVLDLNEIEGNCVKPPPKLVDISEITGTHLEFSRLAEIAKVRAQHKYTEPTRAAIVAVGPFQYGFARMWQSLAMRKNIEIDIFDRAEEALEWLVTSSPVSC
jgi:hypothetical protein